MSPISFLAIGTAFANFFKAKKAYEDALEEQQTILEAVNIQQDYKDERDEQYENLMDKSENEITSDGRLQAVSISPIVKVGNLVGNIFRAQLCLVFTNTSSNRSYNIRNLKANARVFGEALRGYMPTASYNFNLNAGETKEIELVGAKTSLDGATLEKLRNSICAAAGKKLITSCPKINIDGIADADVEFYYGSGTTYAGNQRATYRNCKGLLRYMGEAFFPSENL